MQVRFPNGSNFFVNAVILMSNDTKKDCHHLTIFQSSIYGGYLTGKSVKKHLTETFTSMCLLTVMKQSS